MSNILNCVRKIGKYHIKKQIGIGSTSKIYLAQDDQDNKFSLKVYHKNKFDKQFDNETNILKSIDGECFPKIIDILNNNDHNCIVFPYYNKKDLFDTLVPKLPINEYDIMNNLEKMTKPILDLHEYNIAHLDIKLENYLVNKKNNKLILLDYGSASDKKKLPILMARGTKRYLSPELASGRFFLKSDIWNLGFLALLLNLNKKIYIENYNTDTQYFIDQVNDNDYHLKNFIMDSLVVDYKKRLNANELYVKYFT